MEWVLGIIGAAITGYITSRITTRQRFNELREERKFEYSLEAAIEHLLQNPTYEKRSFAKLKHHLRGFKNDDELRQALIRSGAVAFDGDDDEELWGLLSRNLADVK